MAGISRSAAVCIAFLMRYKDWDVQKAFDFLKDKRPCIAPNLSFMGQLLAFQQQLCTTTSSKRNNPANSESNRSFQTTNKQKEASSKSNTNVKNEDENLPWSPAVAERANDVYCGGSYKISRKSELKLLIPVI